MKTFGLLSLLFDKLKYVQRFGGRFHSLNLLLELDSSIGFKYRVRVLFLDLGLTTLNSVVGLSAVYNLCHGFVS